jgi:hypothetical protein
VDSAALSNQAFQQYSSTGSWVSLVVGLLVVVALWRIYSKAGEPGWASIIPIYNVYVLVRICGRPAWWTLMVFIPLVNIVFYVILTHDLSKAFGHGLPFTLGLILLPVFFHLVLGFGGSRYVRARV